jgi:hypothetical protein
MLQGYVAAQAFPDVVSSFAGHRETNCSAGLPGCKALGHGLPQVTYTEFYARSVDLMLERAGPTSLLPTAENQLVVYDYRGQKEYGLWIDATSSATHPKVINCTIFPFKQEVTPAQFNHDFIHFIEKEGKEEGSAPCGYDGRTCQAWGFTNTFPVSCPSQSGKKFMGVEPERVLLEPQGGGGPLVARNMTNDIHFPDGMDPDCYAGGRHDTWVHVGYLDDFAPSRRRRASLRCRPTPSARRGPAAPSSRRFGRRRKGGVWQRKSLEDRHASTTTTAQAAQSWSPSTHIVLLRRARQFWICRRQPCVLRRAHTLVRRTTAASSSTGTTAVAARISDANRLVSFSTLAQMSTKTPNLASATKTPNLASALRRIT